MTIHSFIINYVNSYVQVSLSDVDNAYNLPFEYLRVFSPQQPKAAPNQMSLVTHKKLVKVVAIESVGKYGARISFDDQHQAIYSHDYLLQLSTQQDANWQEYLAALQESGHSREAMIDIKQV